MLGRTPEREKLFAFTQPTSPVSFALFVRSDDNHRFLGDSLRGKIIGVTKGGLARNHLQSTQPQARYVEIQNLLDGMQRLVRREVDAVAAQEWSGYHLLNEMGIGGIVGLDPFLRRQGNMAVRHEDAALAAELDSAISRLKASGEFDRILDRWSHTRVHLLSQRLATTLTLIGITAVIVLLLLTATLLWQRRQRMRLAREVEQRRELEQRLRASEAELRKADQLKDQFLAILAHELRNPLAPILQASRLIELRAGQAPEVDRARSIIERQTRNLARLVDDLMDVGRIKTGKLQLRRQAASLGRIADEALESSSQLIAAGGHEIRCDVPELWVNGDPVRLVQVLGNLLTNAAKYNARPTRIHLCAREQNGFAAVTVRDEGVGIPRSELRSIFELFHQHERPAVHVGGDGLGIGLWLSRQLIELHGGTLEAMSQGPGHGTEFVLTVPLSPKPSLSSPVQPRADTPNRRILVVDDNGDAADTLATLLQLQGHEVAAARDGRTALAQAMSFRPHLVFLDIGLPDIDGLEVCRQLRRQPGGEAITIVAVTGWGSDEDRMRTEKAGFDGHLTKPVTPEAIEEWLAKNRTGLISLP